MLCAFDDRNVIAHTCFSSASFFQYRLSFISAAISITFKFWLVSTEIKILLIFFLVLLKINNYSFSFVTKIVFIITRFSRCSQANYSYRFFGFSLAQLEREWIEFVQCHKRLTEFKCFNANRLQTYVMTTISDDQSFHFVFRLEIKSLFCRKFHWKNSPFFRVYITQQFSYWLTPKNFIYISFTCVSKFHCVSLFLSLYVCMRQSDRQST